MVKDTEHLARGHGDGLASVVVDVDGEVEWGLSDDLVTSIEQVGRAASAAQEAGMLGQGVSGGRGHLVDRDAPAVNNGDAVVEGVDGSELGGILAGELRSSDVLGQNICGVSADSRNRSDAPVGNLSLGGVFGVRAGDVGTSDGNAGSHYTLVVKGQSKSHGELAKRGIAVSLVDGGDQTGINVDTTVSREGHLDIGCARAGNGDSTKRVGIILGVLITAGSVADLLVEVNVGLNEVNVAAAVVSAGTSGFGDIEVDLLDHTNSNICERRLGDAKASC